MSQRLIDANLLEPDTEWDEYYDGFLSYSKTQIDAQPTVDARPTEHGEWISYTSTYWTKKYDADGEPEYKEYIFYVCKNCRRKTVIKENFCPKCGLDMRVSENKQN
jgi:hypothetical protein